MDLGRWREAAMPGVAPWDPSYTCCEACWSLDTVAKPRYDMGGSW